MNWKRINKKRLPKTGIIVAGSYRKPLGDNAPVEWTTSSASANGWGHWFDEDRTHYIRLPSPPSFRES